MSYLLSYIFKCSPYVQIDLAYLKELLYCLYSYSTADNMLGKVLANGMPISTSRLLSSLE